MPARPTRGLFRRILLQLSFLSSARPSSRRVRGTPDTPVCETPIAPDNIFSLSF
ncbi:hypothetical protein EMIT0111MI5_90062 [Burkholderia sp. IT-111MI5]